MNIGELDLLRRTNEFFGGILSRRTITWFVVIVVIGLSAAIPYVFPIRYIRLLIPLILGLIGVLILLQWPPLGILALVFATLIVPLSIGTGTNTPLNIAVIMTGGLVALWIFEMVARQKQFRIVASRPVLPLLLFCVAAILAFGFGQLPWFLYAQSAPIMSQVAGLMVFLLSAGAFLIVSHQIHELRWLEWMTWLFLISGGFMIFIRLVGPIGQPIMSRLPDGSTGSLYWTWLVAISFSQLVYNRDLSKARRFALLALLAGVLYASIGQTFSWRSGWVPSVAALAVILVLRFPKLTPVLIIIAAIIFRDLPAQLIQGDQYSFDTRLVAWQIILVNIVKASPIFGLGPSNYRFYTSLFPIMGWEVQFNSHNNYVDMIAQIGLLGLLLFIWFALELGILAWRLRKSVPGGFPRAYVVGALGGLVGTLVAGMLGDWILPFVYNVGLNGFRASILAWIFLGGLVVLDKIFVRDDHSAGEL